MKPKCKKCFFICFNSKDYLWQYKNAKSELISPKLEQFVNQQPKSLK